MSDKIGPLTYYSFKNCSNFVQNLEESFKEALVFGQCEDLSCYFVLGKGCGVVNDIILGVFILSSKTFDQLSTSGIGFFDEGSCLVMRHIVTGSKLIDAPIQWSNQSDMKAVFNIPRHSNCTTTNEDDVAPFCNPAYNIYDSVPYLKITVIIFR